MRRHTRVIITENVTTGSVHALAAETLGKEDMYDIRLLHTATEDSGYGGVKRYRGWKLYCENQKLTTAPTWMP